MENSGGEKESELERGIGGVQGKSQQRGMSD
jgi:hypothetical protein